MQKVTDVILKNATISDLPNVFTELMECPSFVENDMVQLLSHMDQLDFIKISKQLMAKSPMYHAMLLKLSLNRLSPNGK
jgi:hypothetical protein